MNKKLFKSQNYNLIRINLSKIIELDAIILFQFGILFVEDALLYFDIVHLGHCKNIMQCYITDVNIK